MPWEPHHKSLYVRTHYEAIVKCIFQENGGNILITGNPGTGKSQCAVYALYCALQKSKVVLYHRSVDEIIILFKRDERVKVFKPQDTMPSEHYDKNTLYLYDAGTRTRPRIQFGMSRRILFSSPSRESTSDFRKQQNVITLNMPIWDLDELKAAATLEQYRDKISTDEVSKRYDTFGGIARYVLHPSAEQVSTYFEELNNHIRRCNIHTLTTLGPTSDLDDKTHMLFHRQTQPDSDYRKYMFDFASPYVEYSVLDVIDQNSFEEMIAFVNQDKFDTCVSSLQGVVFERIVHMILPQEKCYSVRSLSDHKTESTISFFTAKRKMFNSIDMSDIDMGSLPSGESVYLQPKAKTFPAADSLRPPDCIFQCTKSSRHKINIMGLKKIITKLKQHQDYKQGMRFKFYFVVSKKTYDDPSLFEGAQRYTEAYGIVSSETFPEVDQYVLNLGI